MSFQRRFFTNFREIQPGTRWISGIGNYRIEIIGPGEIRALTHVNGKIKPITFHDVLFAPGLDINLIAVAALTKENSKVIFSRSYVYIVHTRAIQFTARQTGDTLYELDITIPTDVASIARPIAPSKSIEKSHRIFVHISYQTLIKMANIRAVDGLDLPPGLKPPLE